MKKILAMALSVILIATLAISGTVAYLTDDESEVNVMTVGKVNVQLHEHQRKDDSSATTLDPFVDNKILMPITADSEGSDAWGLDTRSNYVDKIVRVENIGESDAWVRVFIAVPAELDDNDILLWDDGTNSADNTDFTHLDDPKTADAGFTRSAEKIATVELDDEEGASLKVGKQSYNVYCYTLDEILVADDAGKDMTNAVIEGFYLSDKVDYDDETHTFTMNGESFKYDLDLGVKIPVYVQAIQAAGFDSSYLAFTAAGLNNDDGTPKSPWGTQMTDTDEVVDPETPANPPADDDDDDDLPAGVPSQPEAPVNQGSQTIYGQLFDEVYGHIHVEGTAVEIPEKQYGVALLGNVKAKRIADISADSALLIKGTVYAEEGIYINKSAANNTVFLDGCTIRLSGNGKLITNNSNSAFQLMVGGKVTVIDADGNEVVLSPSNIKNYYAGQCFPNFYSI